MSEPPNTELHVATTRASYDAVAVSYAEMLDNALAEMPWDRAVLGLFAELALAGGGGMVGDLGCGPGRLTGHLAELGLDVFGVDLSPGMIEVARRSHPGLRFEVSSLDRLDLADGSLAGVLAWYSLIHTPPEHQPAILTELHRVLAPGGLLLIAFQVGDDEHLHREQAYGHPVDLDVYRLSPERVIRDLAAAGLAVAARVFREAEGSYETTEQAYLLARRTA